MTRRANLQFGGRATVHAASAADPAAPACSSRVSGSGTPTTALITCGVCLRMLALAAHSARLREEVPQRTIMAVVVDRPPHVVVVLPGRDGNLEYRYREGTKADRALRDALEIHLGMQPEGIYPPNPLAPVSTMHVDNRFRLSEPRWRPGDTGVREYQVVMPEVPELPSVADFSAPA